jgi:hypothetical protein
LQYYVFPLLDENNRKLVVMLFHGASGVGETETAQFIARIMNRKLFSVCLLKIFIGALSR